jgi:2-methylisocitrate lyase-like PEP mutase family enzyme
MAQPRVAAMDAETFDQAVRRAKAYLQAGADCIHPIVLDDLGTLKRLPEAVPAPIICRITLRGTHLRPGPRLQGNGSFDLFTRGMITTDEIRQYVSKEPMK